MIETGAGGGNRQQDIEAMLSHDDSFAHFLKDSMASTSPKPSPQKKKMNIMKKPKSDRAASVRDMGGITHEGVDENLGENFEETPWLPPSIEKAEEFRKKSLYHGGNIRIASLSLVSAPDLGSGTTLYFQFAITMSMCLFIMSVLSLPSLVFIYSGTGMKQEDQDAFGLYRYTLGNIGAQDYGLSGSRCTMGNYAYNDTCITYGNSEISITDASIVMTAMEWVQIFVFFAGIIYLQRKSFSVTGRVSKSQTMISDYTVEVKNIPSDTKDWQLLQHFSELYALNKVDWKGRPAVQGSFPVADVSNTNNPMHSNTWVAECTLHKGIGPFISSFKDKQHLMERLYRCRAQMKMYAENSPHEGGHKLNHYLSAEQRMLHTGMLIDKLTENTIKKKKLKILINTDEEQGAGSRSPGKPTTPNMKHSTTDNQISNPSSIYRNIDAPAVSCYITFQYSESRARCLEDYDRYNSLPYSLFYPPALMFRGNKIRVVKAPEPDQIVWENLELSASAKFNKRVRTAVITIALVILCFIVILQASIYKNLFSNKIPDKYVCETAIPTLYANKSTTINIHNIELTRPLSEQRTAQDAICTQAVPNSFYAVYTVGGDLNQVVGTYSIDACSVGLCPTESSSAFCPCVSTSSTELCYPQGCSANDDGGLVACLPFEASAVGVCYCYDALSNGISANGVVSTLQTLDAGSGDDSCKSFYSDYVLSVGLTYASVITTTVANTFLRRYLKVLAKQEAHTSSDKEQGSIVSKTFQSSFVIMAVIVLIAYGRSSRTPYFLRQLHIFVGPYDDFTRAWYGNIGFYLMTTFIIQSFSPLVYNLFMYLIGKPLLRYYHHEGVRKRTSTSIVMQHDLNMLEVGPVFDSTDHTAQLLTLLFFSMTFAPGLPLLMPLCGFAFLMYFNIDKFLLCRFYQRPPQLGDAAIKIVIKVLPYAAVIRLAIACWMFGNDDIIPDADSSAGQAAALNQLREEGGANGVAAKLFRENTFPLFVLILLIVAAKLIIMFFEYFPLVWLFKFCFIVLRESSAKDRQHHHKKEDVKGEPEYTVHPWELVKRGDVNRQQVAPFTGEYMRFVKHKDEIPDTCVDMCSYAYLTNIEEAEQEDGWEMRNSGDYVIKVKVFTEVKKRSKHKRGDLKKTFEVVADHRCATYNIEKIPQYVIPMQGLREGTLSMMENQIRALQDKNVVDSMLYETFDAGNMESNVIANYNKRKTLKPGETMPVANAKLLLQAALFEGDDEDDDDADDEYPDNSASKMKPVPTQAKNGHAVAVENPTDSFYFAPPTPQTAPPTHGSAKARGVSGPTPSSITAITAPANKVKYGAPPISTPAYLTPGEDEGTFEEHKPYFPKSRSKGASSDQAEDYSGGHKPYYPARSGDNSDDSSGNRKKKKDKKKDKNTSGATSSAKRERDYELPPVISSRPSPPAVIQAYSFEEDENDFVEAPDGQDFDDEGAVGGLI